MGNLMKKYLLAFLIGLGFVGVSYSAATKFTNLEVTGTTTLTGAVTRAGNETATGSTVLSSTTFTGGATLTSRTIAQINALTSTTTGQMLLCSDCTRSPICISSGSVNAGSFVVIAGTGAFAGSTFSGLSHCQ